MIDRNLWLAAIVLGFLLIVFTDSRAADEPTDRTEECTKILTDQRYIAEMMARAIPTEHLMGQAKGSEKMLGDERSKKIHALILEADKAARGAVREWFQGYWSKCMGSI